MVGFITTGGDAVRYLVFLQRIGCRVAEIVPSVQSFAAIAARITRQAAERHLRRLFPIATAPGDNQALQQLQMLVLMKVCWRFAMSKLCWRGLTCWIT